MKTTYDSDTLPFKFELDEGAVVRRLTFVAVVARNRFGIVEELRNII